MGRLITALGILVPMHFSAQDIGRFLDYRDYFFVFDRGTIKELETLPPRGSVALGDRLVYAASNGELKVYHDGETTTIDQNIATLPTITDHYLGYVTAGVMKIYDGNALQVLCRNTGPYLVEDSVAAFYDNMQRTLHVYHQGALAQVEDALMENPVQSWSAGDNTIAWISKMTQEFKLFYRGEVVILANLVSDMPFTAGLDVVAYRDPVDLGLKAFHKGEVINVEPVWPEKIHMGKGLFAYIDRAGALKVFQNGTAYTAADFTPDEFLVKDSLVVIKDKGQLKIFQDGKTSTVLTYFPEVWKVSWGTYAWLDVDGTVKAWRAGEVTTVLQREPVTSISIDRGLITIGLTNNAVRIWWKGEIYSQ